MAQGYSRKGLWKAPGSHSHVGRGVRAERRCGKRSRDRKRQWEWRQWEWDGVGEGLAAGGANGGTCGSVASGGQKRTLRGSSSSMSCPQVKHFSSSVVRSSFEENKRNLSTERMFHPGDSKRVPTNLSFQLNSQLSTAQHSSVQLNSSQFSSAQLS